MTLKERMEKGFLYYEEGNESEEDQRYEKLIEKQRQDCKELIFDYNATRPSDLKAKKEILGKLLGEMGEHIWIEAPVFMSYGCNVHIGDYFYANFNLTIVDDIDVYIGDHVMIAPNVTISATGHPVNYEFRRRGTQFSIPVVIEDDVWIGSNVVILQGVRIGKNSVIGAGSVVTHDIPADIVAVGNPCRVMRQITERDKEYYTKDRKVDGEFHI